MASAKALAAIALTLIIAIPICLGYGLASEDTQINTWESERSINLSDEILNSQTAYTTPYNGPSNNSELLQLWNFPGPGVSEYHLVSPNYNQVSENYSSLPEYTTTTNNYALGSASNSQYTMNGNGSVVRIGTTGYTQGVISTIPTADQYYVSISTTHALPIHWSFDSDEGYEVIQDDHLFIYRDSPTTWAVEFPWGGSQTGITSWAILTDADGTVDITYRNFTDLNLSGSGNKYSFETASSPNHTTLKLTQTGGNQTYLTFTSQKLVVWDGGNVLVDDTLYSNISMVSVLYPAGYSTVLITVDGPSGSYADPSYGWSIPAYSDRVFYSWWTNGQENESVRIMIGFDTGYCALALTPTNGTTIPSTELLEISYTISGQMYVGSSLLGSYSLAMIEIGPDKTIVSGISQWPTMGAMPVALNSITIEQTVEHFNSVNLRLDHYGQGPHIQLRVDNADVVAGYFPSTYEFTLQMSNLFPDRSYAVKFNSIGIYGTFIGISDANWANPYIALLVDDNNKITVDGHTFPLKGAVFKSVKEGNHYSNYVNGYKISETNAPAWIGFGGEWSLTVTGDLLSSTTETRSEWSPGDFAFDKDSFVGVIVLVAALTFIGVGMYGARSGIKAGLLLMICGGAALIALTL